MKKSNLLFIALAVVVLGTSLNVFGAATITIVNGNGPGVGFNDPTPVSPVGGNPGTTLGQQRLNAFQYAANIWGATLDSKVEIQILATFEPLSCNASSAVLGSAGATEVWSDFPNAGYANTWYGFALANKIAGENLDPTTPQIRARFNVNLGKPGCLTNIFWYLGFDANHGNNIDLVTVLEHEFAHGLGFQQFASVTSGSEIGGLTDVYGRQLFDKTQLRTWDQMTNAQRVASAINSFNVVWTGPHVFAAVPQVLAQGTPLLKANAPAAIKDKTYAVGTASFGPPLSSPGVTGDVVYATPPDGCSAITNNVSGKVALVDRGTCNFTIKAKNLQNAGAIAALVADNAAGSPPAGLGGTDATIVIPAVRITLDDGNTLKANLAGLNVTLGLDMAVRAGADASDRALLNAPNPVQSGSSISHWDPIAFPNQLMEPAINSDLTHNVAPPYDLTLPLLRDVGWYPDADLDLVPDDGADQCLGSDLRPTVNVATCNSGVTNTLFTNGCTISDLIGKIAAQSKNHGDFVSEVAHLTNELKASGFINGAGKGAIQSCAAGASIP